MWVVFSGKLMAEKTVVRAEPHQSATDEFGTSCSAGAALAVTPEIVCGSVVLKRISVESIPTRLEALRQ